MFYKNHFFVVLLALLAIQSGRSQEGKEKSDINTIFNRDALKNIRAYGGPIVEYTRFAKENTFFVGGKGGVIFKERFGVGLLGKGKTTRNYFKAEHNGEEKDMTVSSGFGGIFVEYIYDIKSVIHFNVFANLLAGRSTVYVVENTDTSVKNTNRTRISRSDMFGVEPGFGIEVNVTKFLVMNFYATYRYVVPNSSIEYFSDTDFNGATIGINFKFGRM